MSTLYHFSDSEHQSPQYIFDSWKRCQDKGLNPQNMDTESRLSDYEMVEIYDQHAELLHYSTPILEDLFSTLRMTEFLILVATPEGHIINSMGNPHFLKDANKVSLCKGANWSEDLKGTNAIGTAIIEQKPLTVNGSEHYFLDNHFLTCTSSPILGSNQELIGVINMSSYKHNFHPYSLGIVKNAAHSIEQALHIHDMKKKENQDDLDFVYQHAPTSLITLNKQGKIIRMNYAASQTLGSPGPGVIGHSVTKWFPGFDPAKAQTQMNQTYTYKNYVFSPYLLNNGKQESYIILKGEKREQREELTVRYQFGDILGQDPQFLYTITLAERIAEINIDIVILGESGTGKELFAQSIHGASKRNAKPFLAINCSAIPDNLLESELFGYEKGAFTGAKSDGHIGKFEAANGGTLFLDEIGDMPLSAQAALLRVLQEKCVTRIGGHKPIPIDVRIIAATHRNLLEEIEAGRFRRDLYYRMNGFTLKLPSFRERSDLLFLSEQILSSLPVMGEPAQLSAGARNFIQTYHWPGNFRELKNTLQQAYFLAQDQVITEQLLASLCPNGHIASAVPEHTVDDSLSIQEYEMNLIKQTLVKCQGNISQAAKQLNIGRNTLYRRLKAFGLMD
ncbi:MAG TPA: sigma-54-dependent Fis family transcriptional regulator [Bacillota bacterium]|nr:sigma-54-dependent Fis family transcriptional regulator [Bacillota bacterium]